MNAAYVQQGVLSLGVGHYGLIESVATVIAQEARALGVHLAFSPMLGLGRDPRWGRIEEAYGESPYHVSAMGCAFIAGLQGRGEQYLDDDHIVAVAKHFVADGEPARGINGAPFEISEGTLRETHMKPFEDAVKTVGLAGIMPAHHALNRVPCHSNTWLLVDVLKREWGFDGIIVSDMADIPKLHGLWDIDYDRDHHQHCVAKDYTEAAKLALTAEIDVELGGDNNPKRPYGIPLLEGIQSGRIQMALLDRAVKSVLRTKLRLGLFDTGRPVDLRDDRYGKIADESHIDGEEVYAQSIAEGKPTSSLDWELEDSEGVLLREEHNALALETARKAIVLLKNEGGLLPLKREGLKQVAVIGVNAVDRVVGGYSNPNSKAYVSPLEGIRQYLEPEVAVLYQQGCTIRAVGEPEVSDDRTGIPAAVEAAGESDVAIVFAGGNRQTCGENTDVDDLNLSGAQQQLIRDVYATGTPVILITLHGRPQSISWEAEHIPAILEGYYLGQAAGHALADVIFGQVNPGGKLPVAIPRDAAQVPCLFNSPYWASPNDYRGNVQQSTPLFPFGFGLSYTEFKLTDFRLSRTTMGLDDTVEASVKVTNVGACAGDEVVQMYITDEIASVVRPKRELCGFRRITLQPNEVRTISLTITFEALKFWKDEGWIVEPGCFRVWIGTDCTCRDYVQLTVDKTQHYNRMQL